MIDEWSRVDKSNNNKPTSQHKLIANGVEDAAIDLNRTPVLGNVSVTRGDNCGEERKTLSSTATFAVTSPRDGSQEVRPRRTLKVCTTSLTRKGCDSSTLHSPRHVATLTTTEKISVSPSSSQPPSSSSSSPSSSSRSTLRACLAAARSEYFTSTHSMDTTDYSHFSVHCNQANKSFIEDSVNADMTVTSPLVKTSSLRTDNASSPQSSDAASVFGCHRLPVSSILELDIPETNIDEDSVHRQHVTSEFISDELSCTTDESGFTSASSESENPLVPTG